MIRKMEEPNSETLFYSPTFKRYESINFYASLLNVLKQYTLIIDQYSPQIRSLVWTYIYNLLGQPGKSCDIPFTPVINSWLEEKSIDLMDIETYFTAFTQAQFSNPKIFSNFPSIPNTFSIPGISAPSTSFRIPKSQLDLSSIGQQQAQQAQAQPSQNNNKNIPQLPVVNKGSKQQQQQPHFQQTTPQPSTNIPSLSLSKIQSPTSPMKNNQQASAATSSKKNNQSLGNGVWSTELSSIFQQLALLETWIPVLERLPLPHKDLVWRTCKCFDSFINYDNTSFIRTFHIWSNDPLPNLLHITVMFAAIGYLKEMGILRGDFSYPASSVPVFDDPLSGHDEFNQQQQLPHFNSNFKYNQNNSNNNDDEDSSYDFSSESDLSSNISPVQSLSNSPYISPRNQPSQLPQLNNVLNGMSGGNNNNSSSAATGSLLNSKKRKSAEDINDLAVAASLSDPSTPNSPYKDDDNLLNNTLPSLISSIKSNSTFSLESSAQKQQQHHHDGESSPKKIKIESQKPLSQVNTDSESDSNESTSSNSKGTMNINSILCS